MREEESAGGVQKHLNRPGRSLSKYKQTVTGLDSWSSLLMYEFVECFITPVPGGVGRYLRSVVYPFIFASCPGSVKIDENLTIHQPIKIFLSDEVVIERNVTMNVKGSGGGIFLHKKVSVGKGTILSCPGGKISVGEGSVIESQCRLGSLKGLTIGRFCHIGRGSYLIGAAHAFDRLDVPIIKQPQTCRGETVIGDNVRIGSGVTLLDGVRIGNRACIADGSLVLKDVAEESLVEGVPAAPVTDTAA